MPGLHTLLGFEYYEFEMGGTGEKTETDKDLKTGKTEKYFLRS